MKVYGVVPPLAVAVNVTGLPCVGLELMLKLTDKGIGETKTVALPDALDPFASTTVKDSILEPFPDSSTLKLPVPV